MMREMVLTAASLALTGTVVANAYYQKHQFYPSVVYLTKSSPSMAVLYLQAFVFVILLGKLIRKVFFGQLRAAEMEHLIERSWYAVTETCLAFTVFRDDFSPRFVAQFTMLLFVKCFHWLAEDRIDYMERSPVLTWLFHARAVALLSFLGLVDSLLIHVAYNTTIQSGASVQLVFGFEYAILLTIVATILMKYTLHVIDLQSENPWDNKAVYLLYTELIMGFIKAILYVCFVVIMVKVHTFPLFAIRPMYLTLRGFKKSLSDVIMSRRAIANMNTLYPDATPEELSQGDNVCIICREEMTTGCKKIPCNHIFHASCLRSWFQRQQTCPTCRMDVLRPMPRPSPPPTQQPAQPQQPNAPQMMPPFGMFPGWPPVPPPPFQQPGTETTPTTTASTGATAGEAGLMNQAPPFSMPPPFMMPPPPPFMMPPPMLGMPFLPSNPTNTTDLSGLSVEELKNMETQERKNLESRIAMLRNIHALLDTAVNQMNNYTAMFNAQSSSQVPPVNQASTSSKTSEPTLSSSATDWPSLSNITTSSSPTNGNPKSPSNETTTNISPSNETTTKTTSIKTLVNGTNQSKTDTTEPETLGNMDDVNDDSNELRRRRLERFTKDDDNTDTNDP